MAFWLDDCEHEKAYPGAYRGSFVDGDNKYDVYYYLSGHQVAPKTMDVCIRYGPESHEYISAGNVETVRQAASENPDYTVYVVALKMVGEDKWIQ